MRVLAVVVAAMSIILVAACGGSSPGAGGSGAASGSSGGGGVGADPCALFSAAELQSATGITFGDGTPGAGACTWTAAGGDGSIVATFQSTSLRDVRQSLLFGEDLTIGGRAAYWAEESGISKLVITNGSGTLAIDVLIPKSSGLVLEDVGKKLGEIAVGRL